MNLRKLHRQSAPILFLPLVLTALTGIAYRLSKSWFDVPDRFGDIMMALHEGRFLGRPLVPVYVLLVGLGLVALVITGLALFKLPKTNSGGELKPITLSSRLLHGVMAPVFFLPLLVSAATGIIYRLGSAWFGLSDQQAKFFLDVHEGKFLGSSLRVVYILFIGLGLLALLVTGIQMTSIFRNRAPRPNS